jgi:hypothetical protein
MAKSAEEFRSDIDYALTYLSDGGMGETLVAIEMAWRAGQPQLNISIEHAQALCELAIETLNRRRAH